MRGSPACLSGAPPWAAGCCWPPPGWLPGQRLRQAGTFTAVLAGMGWLHAQVVMPELNHFEVPNQLNRADTPLSQAVLEMMQAGRTSQDGG